MNNKPRRDPPVEYASLPLRGIEGWRSLAEETGLPIGRIAALGMAEQLDCLFANGRLMSPAELRSLDASGRLGAPIEGRTAHQLLVDILGKRWPEHRRTPQQKIAELYRQRGQWQ